MVKKDTALVICVEGNGQFEFAIVSKLLNQTYFKPENMSWLNWGNKWKYIWDKILFSSGGKYLVLKIWWCIFSLALQGKDLIYELIVFSKNKT